MEQRHAATTIVGQADVVELRGGRIWELVTETGERVVVDRGFRPRGGDIRNRWRRSTGDPWRRLFGIRPVDVEMLDMTAAKRRLRVAIGARVEISSGFRDVWRTEGILVSVREVEDPGGG